MKIICEILIILVLINLASSAMFIDTNAFHPDLDHRDKCYDKKADHIFSPGDSFKPIGRCMTLNCLAPGKMSGMSCGSVSMPHCKSIGNDLTKPHPDCCERFLCQDENGKDFIYKP